MGGQGSSMASLDSFIEIASWQGTREEAQGYLDAANGNLENAIMLYFDNALQEPHSRPVPANNPITRTQPPQSLLEEINAEYKKNIVSKVAPRVSDLLAVYKLRLPRLISGCFMALDYAISMVSQLIPQNFGHSSIISTQAASSREDQFATTIAPAMANMDIKPSAERFMLYKTYNEALETVKHEFKFLMVILVSEVHSITPSMIAERFLQTRTVNRDDIYVWMTSAFTIEGMGIAKAFNADQLPLISLIGVSPKSADSTVTVMERLVQVSGDVLADERQRNKFDDDVAHSITQQEPKIWAIKLNRQQFDADREIRHEQDSAYEKSLRADREKAEKMKKDHEEKIKAETQRSKWLNHVARRAALYKDSKSITGVYARISLRFPNGDSLNIRALEDAPISDLFNVVYAHMHRTELPFSLPNLVTTEENDDASGTELQSQEMYGVTLTSTVTRSQLTLSNNNVRCNSAVWPSGVLMVDTLD